jgi:glycosyltransferase involved in cell wall biosynthesis
MQADESAIRSERLLVVVPAHNEAPNLKPVIRGIQVALPAADVVVVDDGSTDRTADVARMAGAHVVAHPFNLGYGVAIETGFKFALAGGYDYLIHLDGDGQHEPAGVHEILQQLRAGTADVVVGSRYLAQAPAWTGPLRRWASRLLALLTSRIIGQPLTDPTSGFQGHNRVAVAFCAQDTYPVDYPDADVMIMLHKAGLRIREVPVITYRRASGRSMHTGLRLFYYSYKMMLAILLALLRDYPASGQGA